MLAPLTLRIRAKSATAIGALAPADSKPLQLLDHCANELRARALGIEVLIAEYQGSAMLRCTLSRDPEGASMSDVQEPGGRRRQPAAIRAWIHQVILGDTRDEYRQAR